MTSRPFAPLSLTDDTIDRVARHMTDAEPPARLHARVLADLDRAPAPRRVWWRPVAGLAAVGFAVVVAAWPHPEAPALPGRPAIAAAGAPFVASAATFADVAPQSAPRSSRIGTRGVSADTVTPSPNAIPALAELTPLALDGIQPQPLSIPLLVISPLSPVTGTAASEAGE